MSRDQQLEIKVRENISVIKVLRLTAQDGQLEIDSQLEISPDGQLGMTAARR